MDAIGPYQVMAEVARGGSATVFQVRDPRDGQPRALKLLHGASHDDRARRRFQREVEALSRLAHPHLVPLLDAGEHRGHPYLVLEWVPGETLERRLQRHGPFVPGEAARLVRDLARGLEPAHAQGLLHRDVKPDNVLIDARGLVRLTDFGLAKDLSGTHSRLSASGLFQGTPGYSSPEQARGELQELGPPCDVYGLGATLYALLTGQPPFVGSFAEVAVATLERDPPPPSSLRAGLDPALEGICLRCLSKDPARRYPQAGALARELDTWLQGGVGEASAGRSGARSLALPGVVVLAGAAVAGALLLNGPPTPAPSPQPAVSDGASTPAPTTAASPAQPSGAPAGGAPASDVELAAVVDRGLAAMQAREWAAAEAAFREALALREVPQGWMNLGTCLAQAGRVEEAYQAYSRSLELEPTGPAAYNRAVLLYQLGRREESLRDLERALALQPDDPSALALRGQLRLDLGDGHAALADLNRALELDPSLASAWQSRAALYLRLRERERAASDVERAAALDPSDPGLATFQAEVLYEANRFQEALAAAARALRLEPDRAGAHLVRGQALVQLRRPEEAFQALDRALELEPQLGRAWSARADLRAARGDRAGALEDFARAIEADPSLPEPWIQRGNLYLRAKEPAQAAENYRHALGMLPPDHFLRGFVEQCLGMAEQRLGGGR